MKSSRLWCALAPLVADADGFSSVGMLRLRSRAAAKDSLSLSSLSSNFSGFFWRSGFAPPPPPRANSNRAATREPRSRRSCATIAREVRQTTSACNRCVRLWSRAVKVDSRSLSICQVLAGRLAQVWSESSELVDLQCPGRVRTGPKSGRGCGYLNYAPVAFNALCLQREESTCCMCVCS